MKIKKLNNNRYLVCAKEFENKVTEDWFEPKILEKQQQITGQSVGRGITYFFKKEQQEFVLRRYLRGGFFGRLIKQQYLFSVIEKTRPYRELKLLQHMHNLQLPVPQAVAALIERSGFSYQASIIIALIPHAQDLYHTLLNKPLSEKEWQSVGHLIGLFHAQGIYHSDLNIHNIMQDDKGKLWLIDFDKGLLLKPESERLQTNLSRLLRSLRKEKAKNSAFQWQESDWQFVLEGYQSIS